MAVPPGIPLTDCGPGNSRVEDAERPRTTQIKASKRGCRRATNCQHSAGSKMFSTFKSVAKQLLPSGVKTKLELARVKYRVRHYQSRYVDHIYGGFPLRIHLTDPVAESWYDHDEWSEEGNEISLFKGHRLGPGARIFDIGAHQGVIALVLAKIVGPEGMVVAVEPNSHNTAIARENRDLNNAPQLVIVQAAAADKSGTLLFNEQLCGSVDDGSGRWGKQPVPCLSVDDLTRQYGVPQILWIDVEGFEGKVLEGAGQTLKQRPDCLVEVHVGCGLETFGYSAESIVSFFRTAPYSLFVARQEGGAYHPLEPEAPLPNERFFLAALSLP